MDIGDMNKEESEECAGVHERRAKMYMKKYKTKNSGSDNYDAGVMAVTNFNYSGRAYEQAGDSKKAERNIRLSRMIHNDIQKRIADIVTTKSFKKGDDISQKSRASRLKKAKATV